MSTHPRRRLALALTLGALLTLGAANPAGAEVRGLRGLELRITAR